jgi:hypothetical protein
MAVKGAVAAGKPDLAISHIDSAVAAGTIDYKEATKQKLKVVHDDQDLRVSKAIVQSEDPAELTRLSNQVLLNDNTLLTPDERRAFAVSAQNKADRILNDKEKVQDKAQKEESKKVLGDYATKIRLQGYIPSVQELRDLSTKLTGSDYLALVALVDRKDGGSGGMGSTNAASYKDIQLGIASLSNADQSGTVTGRADALYDKINVAFSQGKLSVKDREASILQLDRHRKSVTTADPRMKEADELVKASISPPSSITGLTTSPDHLAIAQQMSIDMQDARNANPRLDPVKWVQENLPKYKKQVDDDKARSLIGAGAQAAVPHLVYKDGALDVQASKKAISESSLSQPVKIQAEAVLDGVSADMARQAAAMERARIAKEAKNKSWWSR